MSDAIKDHVSIVVEAMKAYEKRCEVMRQGRSVEVWGHTGAFIPEFAPTREGYAEAAVKALISYGWISLDEDDD